MENENGLVVRYYSMHCIYVRGGTLTQRAQFRVRQTVLYSIPS